MNDIPKPLVIVGDGEFAEIACEYFTHDSTHQVVGFAVEQKYMSKESLFGRPVVPFEEIETRFPVAEHAVFVAVTFTQLNRVRARLFAATREKGYRISRYVSSRAFVWHDVTLGDNCFVFENNVLQYQVKVGDNVVLWSGNHVGHRSIIRDHCFLSSHVVVSGYCDIGESCFLGVNATLHDHVKVARDCVIGAGAVISKDTQPGQVYKGPKNAEASPVSSLKLFKVPE